jgi:Zn-dependent protease
MDESNIIAACVIWYVVFLFSTVCHEAAHALAARLGGDRTADSQVTLDPIPHMQREPWGMILVPLLSFGFNGGQWMIGWASTPYNPSWGRTYPHRAARMALAGPCANFTLATIAAITMRIGLAQGWLEAPRQAMFSRLVVGPDGSPSLLGMFLSIAFMLNLLLGIFNLLPFPPLDGSGVVGLFMSESAARRWNDFVHQPNFALYGMLIAWFMFSFIGHFIFSLGLYLIHPTLQWYT